MSPILMTSKTGERLSGDPLSPPGLTRLRPAGCAAVVVATDRGNYIQYEESPAQAAWDREALQAAKGRAR